VANWLVPFMAIGYIVRRWWCWSRTPRRSGRDCHDRHPRIHAGRRDRRLRGRSRAGGHPLRRGARHLLERAGLGTAGIAQSAGVTSNPVRSGLIGMMGTFFDTLVVCSMTGLASSCPARGPAARPAQCSPSLRSDGDAGIGDEVVAIALAVFALTTIFGWSFYGERC